jgi:lysophospholipase L1-like esterase
VDNSKKRPDDTWHSLRSHCGSCVDVSVRQLSLLVVLISVTGGGACSSPPKPTPDPYRDGPRLVCPTTPEPVTSPDGQPVSLTYNTATVTGGAPPVSVTCSPTSGSSFPVGSTAVVCNAADTRQRTDSCSFTINVLAPPKILFTRFAAFGDSITWGEDGRVPLSTSDAQRGWHPAFQVPPSQTYPGALETDLRSRYTTQSPTVTNSGARGERASTSVALTHFSQVMATRPEVVLIMEGSNDVSDRNARVATAAIANLHTMLVTARNQGVRPYLATIPPMLPSQPAWTLVPEFNARIRTLAESDGVPLVDVYGELNTAPDQYLGFDGLHPNVNGYAKIADTFFQAIQATLEVMQPATSTPATPSRGSLHSPVRRQR